MAFEEGDELHDEEEEAHGAGDQGKEGRGMGDIRIFGHGGDPGTCDGAHAEGEGVEQPAEVDLIDVKVLLERCA